MPNKRRIENVFIVSKLNIKIFLIGYSHYGESILIILFDGTSPFYSILIDSYQCMTEQGLSLNKSIEILKSFKISRLDLICWSHPHEDHSKGLIEIIDSFCDNSTKLIFPQFILNNSADIIKLNGIGVETVKAFLDYSKDEGYEVSPIGVVKGQSVIIDHFRLEDRYNQDIKRNVCVSALTPINSLLLPYENSSKKQNVNDLSISLVVNVDDFSMYFGGDTTNSHIEDCDKDILGSCTFVKIPHHSSKTADKLIDYLPTHIDAACTTVYHSSLPNDKVIKRYKVICDEVYSTGDKNKEQTFQYGIVEYDYNCSSSDQIDGEIHKYGNALKL